MTNTSPNTPSHNSTASSAIRVAIIKDGREKPLLQHQEKDYYF
jgi:hypothetical protein